MKKMFCTAFDLLKKALIVLVAFGVVFCIFSISIQKTKSKNIYHDGVSDNRKNIYKIINNSEINSTSYGKVLVSGYRFTTCFLTGEACTDNPDDANTNVHKSVTGLVTNAFSLLYMNPPASGVDWTTSTLQSAGFIPKSYAAEGIGFTSIKPLMGLWKVFRDISYLLLVLFLMVIGFMIIFRIKINPQTVISVENSLPKIAVAMLLITFSFAIAGFLIDLMYIVIAIIIALIGNGVSGTTALIPDVGKVQNAILTAGPGRIFEGLTGNGLGSSGFLDSFGTPLVYITYFGSMLLDLMGSTMHALIFFIFELIIVFFIAPKYFKNSGVETATETTENVSLSAIGSGVGIGKIFSLILKPIGNRIVQKVLLLLSPILLPVVIGIFFLFTIFQMWARIFVLLFKSYLQILLLIIFSPLLIVLEIIPGSKMGFTQWLRSLLGELSAFPIVAILFVVSYAMKTTIGNMTANQAFFAPPYLHSVEPEAFGALVSIGVSLLIPDIVKMVKEMIGGKGIGVNIGAGTFFGGAGSLVGAGMGLMGTYSSVALAFPQLRDALANKFPKLGFLGNTGQQRQKPKDS